MAENIKSFGVWLCIIVITLSSFIFLFNLQKNAIVDYDEGIYAQVIERTLESGNIFNLKIDTYWFEKPPLYIWLSIFSSEIFSNVEFAYRFPSAFTGILSVLIVILITYHVTKSYFSASLSGLILTLTPSFIEAGRQIRFDVPVTMSILFSTLCLIKGKENKIWYLGIGIGIGLGVMFKSVIGLLFLPLLLIYSIVKKDLSWIKSLYFWIGILLMLVVVLPWHIYQSIQFGHLFWNDYLFHHIVNRFESNILGGSMTNFEYIKYLLFYSFPWFVLFLIGLPKIFFEKTNDNNIKYPVIFSIFVLFIISIFFIASTKLAYYLVPIFPFVAMTIGYLVNEVLERTKFDKKILGILIFIVTLGLINTIFVGFHFNKAFRDNQVLANDEKNIGIYLLENEYPEKVYSYNYLYWDTIRFYSKGRKINVMNDDQILDQPFFLIMSTYDTKSTQFDGELKNHFSTIYEGEATSLLKFSP